MAMKISLPGGAVSMRIKGSMRVDVEIGSRGVRVVIVDADIREMSILIGPPNREGRRSRGRSRRLSARDEVTSEMEAAAVEAFLAGADATRLGRSLADVYKAMDAVRRRQAGVDDDDDD